MRPDACILRLLRIAGLTGALGFAASANGAHPAFADAVTVEFESLAYTYKPSPFRVKQAQKLGKPLEIKTEPAITLNAYLARPEGDRPRFPDTKKCGRSGWSRGVTWCWRWIR